MKIEYLNLRDYEFNSDRWKEFVNMKLDLIDIIYNDAQDCRIDDLSLKRYSDKDIVNELRSGIVLGLMKVGEEYVGIFEIEDDNRELKILSSKKFTRILRNLFIKNEFRKNGYATELMLLLMKDTNLIIDSLYNIPDSYYEMLGAKCIHKTYVL